MIKKNTYLLYVYMISSIIYFNGLIKYPQLSPAIIIGVLFVILYFIVNLINKNRYFNIWVFIFLICFISSLGFITYQFKTLEMVSNYFNEIGRITLPFFIPIGCFYFLGKTRLNDISKVIFVVSVIFFINALVRLFISSGFDLYSLKSSVFFADSNYDGYLSLLLYMLISSSSLINKTVIKRILFLSCILSFSRSVWIGIFVYEFIRLSYKYKWLIYVWGALVPLLLGYMYNIYLDITTDGSYITKFEIINMFNLWLNNNGSNVFLGVGSGNIMTIFPRGSHNIFGLSVELGVLFISVYLIFVFLFCKSFVKDYFLVLFVILLTGGVSFYPIAYMQIFFIFSILLSEKNRVIV